MENLTYITNEQGKYIQKISEAETVNYHLLGQATAISLEHALSLGQKYKSDFWERVIAYRITKTEKSEIFNRGTGRNDYILVEFYEAKNDLDI